MNESAALPKILVLLGFMAAITIVETWIPLRDLSQLQGRRRQQNLALTLLFLFMNIALTAGSLGVLLWMEQRNVGLFRWFALPEGVSLVASIVILDFFAYVAHVLFHKFQWLWRVHRVHHSDSAVDVTTSFRQHPIETVLRFLFTVGPAVLFGVSPIATAIYRLMSGINALFEHANIRVRPMIDRSLCWVVVTPHMHKFHHSRQQQQTDSNYGNILSVFDRMFGTYTSTEHVEQIQYGLDEFNSDSRLSVIDLLKLPWRVKQTRQNIIGTLDM